MNNPRKGDRVKLPNGTPVTGQFDDGRLVTTLLGERLQTEVNPDTKVSSVKFRVGNKEDGPDFVWVEENRIVETNLPEDAFVLERMEYLNYYGHLEELDVPGLEVPDEGRPGQRLQAALEAVRAKHAEEVEPLTDEIAIRDRTPVFHTIPDEPNGSQAAVPDIDPPCGAGHLSAHSVAELSEFRSYPVVKTRQQVDLDRSQSQSERNRRALSIAPSTAARA